MDTRRRGHAPGKAESGTWRGLLWTLVIAADFVLMSNPLVFVANMDRALTLVALLTGAMLLATFPWVRVPRVAWSVLVFLAWLLLSYLWSIQPSFTADAWAQTMVVAAVAIAVYANVSSRVLATGFLAGGLAVTTASIYAFYQELPGAVAAPVDTFEIAGIGTNRNILAYTLTLSLCGAFAFLPRRRWSQTAWVASVALIVYVLVGADSSTGNLTLVTLLVTAALMAGYGPLSRSLLDTVVRRALALVVIGVVVAVAGWVLVAVLGQDLLTFSDRTPLWSAAIGVAQERPWGGFGYGAVWQHPWKPPLLNIVIGEIWDRSGEPLSHGHNSAVDLVVEVGVVGVVLLLAVMVAAALRAVASVRVSGSGRAHDPVRSRFTVLCLVALVLFGVTEPMATIPLGWWTLVLLTEPLRRSPSRGRRAKSRGWTRSRSGDVG